MKLRSTREGLAVKALFVALLAKDTLVKITSTNYTVDKAVANDFLVGRVSVPPKTATGEGTVELAGRFKELIEIKAGATLASGAIVKMAAADGTTGENVATTWVSGTDAWERAIGVVWKGASSGGTLEVLTF